MKLRKKFEGKKHKVFTEGEEKVSNICKMSKCDVQKREETKKSN